MPRFFGEIKDASLENLSSDPAANTQGRVWYNQTEGRAKLDNGTNKRALLRNDDKLVLGNSLTVAENVRLNRAAAGLLQLLLASNPALEGALATGDLGQISARVENYTDAGKPSPGNPGRLIYVTDLLEVQYDNGATWLSVAGSGTGGFGALGVTVLSSNTVLTTGDAKRIFMLNSTGGSFNVELPLPTANILFSFKDYLGLLGTNPVTLTRSNPSVQIEGLTSDYVFEAPYGSWDLFCDGSNYYFA